MPDETSGEHTHFWRAAELGGVELLHARYVEQRFAPHVHSSFALVIIEQGAQRFRHRGGEHLAPLGSMVLINPDEVHTGSKAHDAGWLYRGYYPEMEQIDGILDELEIHHGGVPRFADSVIHDQPLARAFVHLHRLLAEHAGSLETQTRWRETMLALFRRHARLPEAPKAGQEPLAVAR
ncbi:AraC family transcriptional regulator, partial [Pseudomonas aeruginosa]|nr:AraC family transcriptional regulator [Pseudomonas aeruginosa]